ncbi:MAG: hypothetical protein GWN18_14385, partial [Thermoplasmata archaeon]|nr:hypothetical protein [Thermoplasmata archaeon]NIS13242.1 hypothetical protein [Thermoplasmata archaeon]NIS21134.1 hypothetical protein [Thermoplasmata archaeon]NIT78621.1 hypothetical protein [Thermoplasmata archaeon]NIU50189.1 hypothetical protein [Thermoplasmata archaeon]
MVSEATVIMVLIVLFAMMATIVVYAIGYRKVPPNKALVVLRMGRRADDSRGGVISGGGRFIMPGVESHRMLDLTVDLVKFELDRVETTSQGRPITMRIKVAALWKITTQSNALMSAASSLVERTHGENRMAVKETLEGAIRELAASSTLEDIETDRDLVSARVQVSASELMDRHGLEIRSIVFLKIKPK